MTDVWLSQFSTQELVDELSKREGIISRTESECIVKEIGCMYNEYSDCADCVKEHGYIIIAVKKC